MEREAEEGQRAVRRRKEKVEKKGNMVKVCYIA